MKQFNDCTIFPKFVTLCRKRKNKEKKSHSDCLEHFQSTLQTFNLFAAQHSSATTSLTQNALIKSILL